MIDREAVARWPEPAYTTRQASSYDRSRVAPDKPGWFENRDNSNYVRTEDHAGRQERVMMEADGAGAIVRFFLTSGGSRAATIRVYLDGVEQPAIEWPAFDLLGGDLRVGEPLALRHPAPLDHGGSTLYLPIPYARHCKVTVEESNGEGNARYYHINYRTYAPGTVVETFTRAGFDRIRADLDRVNATLASASVSRSTSGDRIASLEGTLDAGAEKSIDLPAGAAAISQLELSIGDGFPPAAREQALRSVVLRATFDDQADAIWCPVGDFTGSGAGGRAVEGWTSTVDEQGNAICRWTMPYRLSGKLTLQNLGNQPVPVRMTARVSPWTWDDRSMHFHANWHQQTKIPARPFQDWNFASVIGRGVLVGDVMSVFNPLPSWYGEGDEKIWVDGESFPSHLGTGTEDYYNASWAPNPVFKTPFANHPRMDGGQSEGHNVYTRTRSLDAIPFTQSLKFDFEIMTWKDSQVDYAATTYWYGLPGAKSNVEPQPIEARRPVPSLPPPMVFRGARECESLAIVGRSEGLNVETQDMLGFKGSWSAHAQLLIKGRMSGDYVELAIPVSDPGPQRISVHATSAKDYGILKFTVNGHSVEETFDGFAEEVTPSGPIPLGVFTPQNGMLTLRAELVGTNDRSTGERFLAALDAIVISAK